ncbi:hypothetical protein Taro_040139 [Colocasia esculenta]|uniref:Uncharacterized protein n=1 Tax=Colocasia esculenta TaxID=4460 RepID=A0A843WCE1_COLES|nr:hypothetical protein [Colocasia esculenta]
MNQVANPEANKHTDGYSFMQCFSVKYEIELKWPLTFQEVFDKTHKKGGTYQYINDKAQEVAESYSQQMIDKYTREKE